MTPLIDDLTAALIAVLFGLIALITIHEARRKGHRGEIATGLAAIMVSVVYLMPVLFNVPVVDIRGALRVALVMYSLNYTVSHYGVLANIWRGTAKRIKTWNSRRS